MLKLQAKDWVWSLFVVEVIYTYIYFLNSFLKRVYYNINYHNHIASYC